MAKKIQQLPEGQINPAAKSVDVFVQPKDIQVARPTQFSQVPSPTGVSTVQTGGTTYVQGFNQAKQLADALAPFTKQAMQTAETVGLKYASWAMNEGERQAREAEAQAVLALSKIDESTEVAEIERARSTRRVAAKDPEAGFLMRLLDPYTQMGWQRGKSKIAGEEVALGMPAFLRNSAEQIDPNDGTYGLVGLQSVRAKYVDYLSNKHGIDLQTPGFQKYVLPEIEETSEKLATKIQQDSIKYFDEQKPRQLASQLQNQMAKILAGNVVINGQEYFRKDMTPVQWRQLSLGALSKTIENNVANSAFPGEASNRIGDAYEILATIAATTDDRGMKKLLNSIPSRNVMKDSKGKVMVDPVTGQKKFYTLGQWYQQESAEIQIKISQAAFEANQAAAENTGSRFEAILYEKLENVPEGANLKDVADQAKADFILEEKQRRGIPLDQSLPTQDLYAIDQAVPDAFDSVNEGSGLPTFKLTPGAQLDLRTKISTSYGSDFNAAAFRKEATRIAKGMGKGGEKFLGDMVTLIKQREKEVADLSQYDSVLYGQKGIIDSEINTRILKYYGSRSKAYALDQETSEQRQLTKYRSAVTTAIREKEAEIGGRLTQTQAAELAKKTIDEIFKGDPESYLDMFPGAAEEYLPGALPSLIPSRDRGIEDNGVKSSEEGKNTIRPTVYNLKQLDSIPNRAVELRQYESKAILSLQSLRELVESMVNGEDVSDSIKKARFDSGAPNLWNFIEKQLEQYPNYQIQKDFTPVELNKLKEQLVSSSGWENNLVSTFKLREQNPRLAQINNWIDPMENTLISGMSLSGDRYLTNWEIKFLKDSFSRDKGAGRSLDHYFKFYPELFLKV